MRRLVGFLSTPVFLWSICATCLAAEPFARATVETKGPIVAGQQISIAVDVFAPNFFTSPPQFPLFDLVNAVVTLPAQRSQNLLETIDGVQYAGIRRIYAVVPEVAGSFTLPGEAIPFGFAGDDGKTVAGSATIPPTQFTVAAIPGQDPGSVTFAAEKLMLSQTFDRDPATLKVGETLVRTVTVFAGNTQAMMIPAPFFSAPSGVTLYGQTPVLTDDAHGEDGQTGSSRTDRESYVMQQAGTFEIPAVSLDWFDTSGHAEKTATIGGFKITVTAAPPPSQAIPPPQAEQAAAPAMQGTMRRDIIFAGLAALVAIGLYAALRFLLPALRDRARRRAEERQHSEAACFQRLLAALDGRDPQAAYRALDRWTQRAGFRSIAEWLAGTGRPELKAGVDSLEMALFGTDQADAHLSDLNGLRRQLVLYHRAGAMPKSSSFPADSALPPLNPYLNQPFAKQ